MKKFRFIILAIILVALALRLYNLTYHSVWFDEAISVHWARQTTPRILEVGFKLVEDRLPPLYYLMLKGWTTLFDFSEVSIRGLSVLFGVLLVPVMASIAATLFSQQVARNTALLIALNPFLIWYSQEARMYAPAVLFGTLAIWAFLRVCASTNLRLTYDQAARRISPPQARKRHASRLTRAGNARERKYPIMSRFHSVSYPLLFILFATAGLYSHLYTGFLLPALGVWLIVSYPRAWRLWLIFAFSGLIIAVVFAPIAIATWRFSGEATSGEPLNGIGQRAWWLLRAFTVWNAPLSTTLQVAIPASLLLLATAAYVKPQGRSRQKRVNTTRNELHSVNTASAIAIIPRPLLFVTLVFIFPFAIANLLLFRNHLAFFGERYFIVMVPWLLLLAAVGVENLGRWGQRMVNSQSTNERSTSSSWLPSRLTSHIADTALNASHLFSFLLLLLLYVLTGLPIPGQWSIPAAKEAWRQAVAYLAQHTSPNHGILIHPDWVRFPFQFYFQGPGQTYAAFSSVTSQTPLDGPLQGVVGDHTIIWLVQSHLDEPDPNRLVEQWFDTRYPLITELYPPGIVLKGYASSFLLDTLPPEVTPIDIRFENGMRLVGYETDQVVSATDELFHPPSGWVHVTLYWTANQTITIEATPFVRLTGPEGVWGINLDRTNDALKFHPPSQWSPASKGKTIVRHDVDVNLNPATPPGIYQLVVGLNEYEAQVPLAEIEVR